MRMFRQRLADTDRLRSPARGMGASWCAAAIAVSALAGTVGVIALRAAHVEAAADLPAAPPAGTAMRPPWLGAADPIAYTGSDSCAECHADEHAAWKTSMHVQMTKPVSEAKILGTFARGTTLAQHGRSYRFERDGDGYFIWVQHGDNPAERFEVHYTLGVNRAQGYLSRLADGRIYVLPVFWHSEWQRWIDWKEITPVPDTDHDLRQIWNVSCFNCHATHLVKHFTLETRRYETSWSEMGIGCEACHGPGAAHVSLTRAWKATPALKPVPLDTSKSNRALSATVKIFTARSDDRRQVFDTCAYCHGNKTNVFVGFQPGMRYDDFALPFLPSQAPVPDDPQGDFWPDGRPSRFNRPQALMQSGCFEKSDITCATCHAIHGSKHPSSLKVPRARHDELCLQCHETAPGTLPLAPRSGTSRAAASASARVPAGAATDDAGRVSVALRGAERRGHTHHQVGTAASRCDACHMSDVNWRLLMRRRDHTFQPPVPELTAKYGVPNACNECHDDKSPEWAIEAMDRWWGDSTRRLRVVEATDAMYRAQAMDPTVLAQLGTMMVDRTRSPILRASAAEFTARLLAAFPASAATPRPGATNAPERVSRPRQTTYESGASGTAPVAEGRTPRAEPPAMPAPAAVAALAVPPTLRNALIAAAADPEATVRTHAVRALSALGDSRAVPALAARLIDPARVVRAHAAEALAQLGIVSLPGNAGVALRRAQDEYAASLATFGDNAGDHLALGWFEMERRNDAQAIAALQRALTLSPDSPKPRVFLGVIAARNGDYAGAIREWKKVRSAMPSYPNIDRLIEEAERLKGGPGL